MTYDLLVVGGTFTGIGAALSCGGRAIIVEGRPDVGYEWLRTFEKSAPWKSASPLSKPGQALCTMLEESQLFRTDKSVRTAEIAPYVYHLLELSKQTVLLLTQILSVQKKDTEYVATVHHAGGIETLHAKKVIDATYGVSLPPEERPEICGKTLNAIIWGNEALPKLEGAQILPLEEGQALLRFPVAPKSSYMLSRHDFMELWRGSGHRTGDWRIAAVAECFSMIPKDRDKKIAPGYELISPYGYASPLEALEAGAAWTKRGEKA